VAAVAALLLVAIAPLALLHVGRAERVWKRTAAGAVRVAPGWHLRLPFLASPLLRLPAGPLRAEGRVELKSSEGVQLAIPYTVTTEVDDVAAGRLLASAGGGSDPSARLHDAATRGGRAWGSGATADRLVLGAGARRAEEQVRAALLDEGFAGVQVHFGKVEGAGEVLAAIETRALRDQLADTGTKIALIGLDGADWEIIDPLIDRGLLPNLARLKARGAWGNMKSMNPMLSPLLWTTVATGKPPEEHGIIDFLMKDARTGKPVPVTSRWRKVKALWNIFDDAGRSSAFIAWWATWPAEPVKGYIVSDRVAYSLFGFRAGEGDQAGATYPPGYYRDIRPLLVDDAAITLADLRPFVQVTAQEFAAARARLRQGDPKIAYREPLNHLTRILASERSYQAIGRDILARGQPDLFSIYYQGIDEVCHRFAHFMPPKMAMASDADYAAYHGTVFAYYRYQDRLLGEILDALSDDTTVIVLSDHGFKNGGGRPVDEPPYIEGKPGLWHRRYGILLIAGPPIRRVHLDTSSLEDIAPTILYLEGLPVPEDMPGRVIEEAITPRFRDRFEERRIPSYESIGSPRQEAASAIADADSGVDQAMIENLRSLGYIGGGADAGATAAGGAAGESSPSAPDGQALTTGYLNEASLYLKNKEYRKAEEAVGRVLQTMPDFVPALLLVAQIESEQKHYPEALRAGQRAMEVDPEGEHQFFTQLGRIFADAGRADEGIAYLRRIRRDHPRVGEIPAAIGSLLLKQGKTAEAEQELLRALRINPALGEPLTELHTIYQGTARILELEPIVREGLRLNETSVVHHNWMGLIYEWKKQIPQAEQEFKRAMELDPDYAATMANLGALYGRTGRMEEAVTILNRAVTKDPENLEAWINLGAAQGRLGRAREAIRALETARGKGAKSTTLYNALALAYLQDRQRDKALHYLKESLALDPDQKDARELLSVVSRSS
jgi:tetratricopeptide (TPR) repeat protein